MGVFPLDIQYSRDVDKENGPDDQYRALYSQLRSINGLRPEIVTTHEGLGRHHLLILRMESGRNLAAPLVS
eukprot:8347361-Pyramimonas_sp.AAC.1